jgi:ribosomal protein S18 acetylase RimI-like enzyme
MSAMASDAQIRARPARRDEAALIAEMNRRMALETEGLELDGARLLRGVEAVFDDPHKGQYFVAEGRLAADQPLRPWACLLITREWSDWRAGWFWWIQSVYTEPSARGRGCYSALYAQLLTAARADPTVRGLRLYVERDNRFAQAVYAHLGMQETHYRLFEAGL